jgi:hypothetical protein
MGKKNTYCRREINYENIEIFCIPIGDSHVGEIDPISLDLMKNSKKNHSKFETPTKWMEKPLIYNRFKLTSKKVTTQSILNFSYFILIFTKKIRKK